MKKLYLLLGPKGAGKSHISALMEKEWNIKFFRVEDIWLELDQANLPATERIKLGRQRILTGLEKLFNTYSSVSIESTGTSVNFEIFVRELRERYQLVLVKVTANTKTCMTRIKNRDLGQHVNYAPKELMRLDKIARELEFGSDLVINNDDVSDKNLKEIIETVVEN